MKTVIYYFTGTGNSLWSARLLGKELGDAELMPMTRMTDAVSLTEAAAVGLVFPVHMWGVPAIVLKFCEKMAKNPGQYHFAVAVNAGQVSRTLIQIRNHLGALGIELCSGFDLKLPSNYIPWGGPGSAEELQRRFQATREKIKKIAAVIRGREHCPVERGPLWQRILFTAIYRMTFKRIAKMDMGFWVDEKCNVCGICARICPVKNIAMAEKRPHWRHHCEQCLACIQWCPQEAIQIGKKTPHYPRYHHPEIHITEMLDAAPHSPKPD